MGEVYRAHDTRLSRDVAIKTLPPTISANTERIARFSREARVLASLNHPKIAAIYGLEKAGHLDHLVMELVEGEILSGPVPVGKALDYARQVAEALEAAHAKGIIHRDIKPANVKVTPDGKVKVLDFGLAKAVGATGETENPSPSNLSTGLETLAGHVMGSPAYMSPEQARGNEVDERTDIWAFGCLLYELLSGKRAFQGESSSDTIAAVLNCQPDWKALPGATPRRIRELLRRCLDKDGASRLQSITDARKTLEQAQRGWNPWQVGAIAVTALAAVAIGAAVLVERLGWRRQVLRLDPNHQTTGLRQPARIFPGWAQGRLRSRPGDVLRPRPDLRENTARWRGRTTDARQLAENESGVFSGRRAGRIYHR